MDSGKLLHQHSLLSMATSDSSMPIGTSDHTHTVEKLTSLKVALSDLLSTLKEPATQAELNAILHDPEALPHKEVGSIAAEVVNILDDAKQMLQPSQLVLADHFMGLFPFVRGLRCRC